MARDVGVIPQTYRSDNGPAFASHAFAKKLEVFEQVLQFAGAGAHHQNGVAERATDIPSRSCYTHVSSCSDHARI